MTFDEVLAWMPPTREKVKGHVVASDRRVVIITEIAVYDATLRDGNWYVERLVGFSGDRDRSYAATYGAEDGPTE